MEIFILFRKHLEMSGIILEHAPQNSHPFNLKNSAVIILASFHGILVTKPLDEANTFEEYTDIVNRAITVNMFTIFYVYFVLNTLELYGFVNWLEDCVTKSKKVFNSEKICSFY